jgi:uncharacterized protein YggU (UPF0235/DUF167 family)
VSEKSWLRATASGVSMAVRVTPRASKTLVGPVKDGRLLVRVTAPPVDSAANDAALRAIAEALGVSRGAVQIATGLASRNKNVHVAGLTAAAVARVLNLSR